MDILPLQDSTHAEYAMAQEWVDEDFDPARCDLVAMNRQLARLR